MPDQDEGVEMVERCLAAVRQFYAADTETIFKRFGRQMSLNEMIVRTVIAAMREPTEAMRTAMRDQARHDPGCMECLWYVGIAAALSPSRRET